EPERLIELTNIAKSATDHRIQATKPEHEFHAATEIRPGLPPHASARKEAEPHSETLENAFALGFIGAGFLTICAGLNESPFLSLFSTIPFSFLYSLGCPFI